MAIETLHAISASENPYNNGPFNSVCEMEDPLREIADLLTGLTYMGEGIPDVGSAIVTVAQMARDQCESVQELRGKLFHETHPRKEEFAREGSPEKAN